MITLKEVFGITNDMDSQTQKRTVIHQLGYEEVKRCIPFTLEELKTMQQKDSFLNDNQEKWERAARFVSSDTIIGSKLTALFVQYGITVFCCYSLVGILKECARMWIKEDSTKKLIEKVNELEEIQNKMTGTFKDADTVLVDILNGQDYEFSGFSQDVFNIWKNSSDKEAVEQMFFEFTGLEFKEYLEKAITTTNISIVANQMTDSVSEWLKEKSAEYYDQLMWKRNVLTDNLENTLAKWSSSDIRNNKAECFGILIDTVEDYLVELGMTINDISCEDREDAIENGQDSEELGIIYGEDYDYLVDKFSEILDIIF